MVMILPLLLFAFAVVRTTAAGDDDDCCLCQSCESPQADFVLDFTPGQGKLTCQDIEDTMMDLASADDTQRCRTYKANYQATCCKKSATQINSIRQQLPRCNLCDDQAPPGKPCEEITVGLGKQSEKTCREWYNWGLQGRIDEQTCSTIGAMEKSNNACGCNRRLPAEKCDADFDVEWGPVDWSPASCFAGNNLVQVRGKGLIRMDELQVGDYVADSFEGTFSRVYSFAHVHETSPTEYLQIQTKNSQPQPLEISSSHILFVSKNPVMASQVKIGDMLGVNQEVVGIRRVQRPGVYNPLTYSGKIVVSGVLSTNYVGLVSEFPAVIQYLASHIITSPVRLACAQLGLCSDETHDALGISSWISFPFRVALQINHRSTGWLQISFASIAFGLVLPFLALSLFVEYACNFQVMMALAAGSMILVRSQSQKQSIA